MTREELEQLRYLPGEIRMLKKELAGLPAVCDSVTGSRRSIPYDQHVIQIEGVDRRRENYLKQRIVSLEKQRLRLEKWIELVGDSQIRQILWLRYRDGLSWQQVAFQIGHYDEQYPRRKLKEFIKNDENNEF